MMIRIYLQVNVTFTGKMSKTTNNNIQFKTLETLQAKFLAIIYACCIFYCIYVKYIN